MQRYKALQVLLVEDNPDDVEITRRAFEKTRAVSDLTIVRDGRQALDLLLGEGQYADGESPPRPDLVLLDVNLPKVNGFEVLQQIRSHEEIAMIPVIMLTASVREEDVLRAYQLGANSYIQKPLVFDTFLRVLGVLGEYWLEVATLPRAA
jgi:two-component system response regulator